MSSIHRAIAFIILGISALALSGYMFFNDVNMDYDVLNLKSLPSGFFSKIKITEKEYVYADLVVEGVFDGIVVMNVEDVIVELNASELKFILNGNNLLSTRGYVVLENYSGAVDYNNGFVSLYGDVDSIKGERFFVRFDKSKDILFNQTSRSMVLKDIYLREVIIGSFRGSVKIVVEGDSILYNVSNKDIDVKNMRGVLRLEGNKIFFEGEGILKTSVLISPVGG